MATIDLAEARRITDETEKKYGLPSGTLYKQSGIESSFNSDAVSPKGAKGYFQFMDPTAAKYGVKVGDFSSEADGAGRYMRDSLAKYGGNLDLALADYNGGPKAAAALAKGKPWAETAGYLSKFYGGDGKQYQPISSQFTTGDEAPLSASPSASELYRDTQQQQAQYGGVWNNAVNLPGAVADGFRVDNSVYNFFQDRGVAATDPAFQWNEDRSKQYLDGIPQQHWDYILQSKSDSEATYRKSRLVDTMEREQELGRMGVAGFGGRLVGSLVDLPTLVAFVPGMGGEAFLSTTSRIANAARLGLFNAAFNVAADAATGKYRPTFTTDSLYMSAAMGLGLGAAIGMGINPSKLAHLADENARLGQLGLKESKKAQIKELDDLGLKPGPGRDNFVGGGVKPPEERFPGTGIVIPGEGGKPPKDILPGDPPSGPRPPEEPVAGVPKEVPPEAPKAPVEAPTGKSYGKEWDTPRYASGSGADNLLVLPPAKRVSELADYVRTFSKNPDFVHIMDSVMKGVDLRRLKFKVVEKGQRFGQQDMDRILPHSKGAVMTPGMSTGNDIQMFLRGHSWEIPGINPLHHVGLNEETFIHEMIHVASVYKLRLNDHGGLRATDSTVADAARGLKDLHTDLVGRAQKQYGAGWKTELEGRLGVNLENEKELISYGLTNRNFQNWLREQKMEGSPDKNLWNRFTNGLRKLLGIGQKDHDAFTRLIDLTSPLIKKGGVERTSVTRDLVPGHSTVDADTVEAANRAEIPTVFGWGLGLENRLGGAKAPSSVRDLASKLFGTTIGYKDHSVVKNNAWDDTTKWAEGWAVEMRKGTYPHFEDWLKEQNLPWHKKGEAFEDFGNQVSNYVRGFEGDYPKQVVAAGEQMRKTLAKAVDYINNPMFDEGLTKRGLTEVEIRDPETGNVDVVGKLEKNPNYLPRKHDINKWNDMANSFGRDAVEGWWARAYQAGRDGISDQAAARWAKWYVRTVEEAHANRSQDLLEDIMRGTDKDALKASLKANGGFDDFEAQGIIDDMFPTKPSDGGRMASLKHRNTIQETHTETWTRSDGSKVEVNLNDFIHSNAFEVVEPYLRRTAGSVALAKHLDIYKTGHIDDAILEATTNKLGSEFKAPAELAKFRKDLKFAFERIQGLPQEEFSSLNKGMEMWRNFNVIRLMGGAVWNQATELSQIVGSMGWKATLGAIPELRALKRDIATGKAPNDILDHLENTIGGVGSEYVARLEFKLKDDWVRNKGDTAFNRKLDAFDTAQRKLAKGVLDYTGMTPLMIQQKRVHAVALVNHFVEAAKGKASIFLTKDRLAWMGLDEAGYQRVLGDIDKYTKPHQGEFAKTNKMDFAGWAKESPETYSKFMTAIHRESRRVVQENDLASMVPLMGTTLGKTVFQFMNFSIHGWNKSLNFAMNHRDFSTFSTMMHGSLFASLAYMGRTLLGAQGMSEEKRQEFLDKRMATGQIVANGFGRISQVSLLPVAFDTISPWPQFSGLRTTSDLSSMASNPTYQALNGLISMKKLIRNGVSDEYQTTDKDIRTWGKLLPLNNVVPISNLLNSLANDYPHSESTR